MNSLTIKVYIASGYNANKGKLILNNVEYPFDSVMPDSDNVYELYFGFANPITLPVTGQLFIIDASDDVVPFDHNGTIQVNQGYGIYNYDYNNPCYMEFELEQPGQPYGDPSIEFGSVSNPWYYNQYAVSSCNQPSYYELKCGFNYGGSVRPAKTFIRWGTNEPYTKITYGGVNPDYFSWQEQSVPSGEIGTLVVEFVDSNNNGLTVDSYSSQNYVFDTDTAGSYGGTRLLIKSPDDSNIYDYAAGNFIECNITLKNAQPVITHDITLQCDSTKGTVGYSTDGGYNWTTGTNLTVTVNDGDNLEIRAEGLTGQYDFSVWSDGNTNFWRTLTNIQADATYSATFVTHVFENTMVFTGATVTGAYFDCDNGEGYVWYPVTNNTIQFDDGDFWSMKKLTTTNGDIVSSVDYSYPDGTTGTNTITNPEDQIAGHYEDAGSHSITINSTFPYPIPDLSGRRFGNAENEESWYFTAQNAVHYQNGCGEGATSVDLNITAWIWDPNSLPQNCWNMQTDDNIGFYYDPAEDKFYDNYADYYPEIYYDPCNPPQPTEKHIYLCDNSGAHLAEMTNTGSTWNVSGAFTSGRYSIRATVEGEYNDAWFKFYQTSGDNRIFVGAGDDPSFEDIGTYIMIDDILTSFSLTEDQTTNYYVVSYENTGAITTSMVENIVNTTVTEQGFVTGSDIAAMSYITMTDVQNLGYIDQAALSNMSYITMTDVQSLGYIDQTTLDAMSYVDQTSLSSMAYVDNTYLSTYMNAVVGDINSILQTI